MDDETAEIELLQQNLNKTRQISKRMTNIDKTLEKIDDVATREEDLSAEESLILRGPQAGQLHLYKEAVERLNANIAFKAGESAEIAKIADLVETGAKRLVQLYTKIVAEGSSGPTPTSDRINTSLLSLPSTFTPTLLPTLTPIVKFLRGMPIPATHPSHPAAQGIARTLMDAQRGFSDMRGNWCVKCLDAQGKRLVVRAGTSDVDPLQTGREFGEWVEIILATADLVQRRRWRSDEFLADIKLAALPTAVGKGGVNVNADVSTKVLDFTVETVKYISKIPEVEGAVSAALLALGDGNWKMGEGIQVGQKSKGGDAGGDESENVVLEHFIHDVIQTTITSLQTISRPPSRRPAFGAVFLLNNVAYLRAFLPAALLAPPTVELVQSNFRTAKAGYFDSNFTPLMQAISDAPLSSTSNTSSSLTSLGGGGKSGQVKDKFARFYELFEEVVERHRMGRLLDEEGVERERKVVEEEVVRIVVESFRRFCVKAGGKGKNTQKYIKKTPDDIEAEIRSLF
ncbi:hypothetical protein EST38_g12865 [Candolleomyces aberdarensis]|uniref:Exocyst complex protein EXO70 n=1 Tax=Candolleomyces aberdarensis TaxID=2316362 RepID=A0A4Q2D1D2_9AGAR|nr:hypothetical protein EST38_g12865 [Candolleomyces aberdarensis]